MNRAIGAGLLAAWLAAAHPAAAHVVLAVPEAQAGGYYKAVFRVPHGCDGAPTTAITVELPPEIVVAKPMPKPGWTLAVERAPLPEPVVNEGRRLTERVKTVRWEGGPLPDEDFDEFEILVRLPAGGERTYFPVVQRCAAVEVGWVQRPPAGEAPGGAAPHPAPSVRLRRSGAGK